MTNALLIIAPRKPERFDEVERAGAPRRAGTSPAAPISRVDAEPRADVVVLDTIGELAPAVPDRDRGVRRRQPRRRRRPQHPRAGGVRQADRLWSAHAELRGDRARRSSTTARPCRSLGRASSSRRCSSCSAIRCGAPASAPRRARWSKPTAAPRGATLRRDRRAAAAARHAASSRPFRRCQH